MTNYCFKNAVIGKYDSFEPSWPCLEDSKNKSKKYFINKLRYESVAPEFDVREHDLVINLQNEVQTSVPMVGLESSSSNSHEFIRKDTQRKDDFPELSTSISRKICNSRPSNCTLKCDHSSSPQCRKSNFKHSFKYSKHKSSVISVPLVSFLKPTRVKLKRMYKSSCEKQNVYCGNRLDGDRPVRRKGKVRLQKKKFETKLKKEIILSRRIKSKSNIYDQDMLKIKSLIPSIVDNCKGEVNINRLEALLASLTIVQTDKHTSEAENIIVPNEIAPSELPIDKGNNTSSHEEQGQSRQLAKSILHSQTFKPYCTNVVNQALLVSVEKLILALRHFQDRQHAKNPVMSLAKRRYLCGFKETKKCLLAEKVKLVIIATNLQIDEDLPSGHILKEINSLCEEKNIALIFAGKGNQIGYWTLKRRRISVVSILNYDGAESHFREVMKNWEECKSIYRSVLKEIDVFFAVKGNKNQTACKNVEEEIREKILSKLSLDLEEILTTGKDM